MIYTIKAIISFESEIQIEAQNAKEAREAVADISFDQWLDWHVGEHSVENSKVEESR